MVCCIQFKSNIHRVTRFKHISVHIYLSYFSLPRGHWDRTKSPLFLGRTLIATLITSCLSRWPVKDFMCFRPGRHQLFRLEKHSSSWQRGWCFIVGKERIYADGLSMIFPTQRPVTLSFNASFDLRLNKRWSKQSWGWWFETPSRSLWRHRNDSSEAYGCAFFVIYWYWYKIGKPELP